MEAGERYQENKQFATPLSIFDAIRIGRPERIEEEKDTKNRENNTTKGRDYIKEFCFPFDIF